MSYTPGDYYDDKAKKADEIRARIATVEAELAEEPLSEFGKKIAWRQLQHLKSMLEEAMDTGD